MSFHAQDELGRPSSCILLNMKLSCVVLSSAVPAAKLFFLSQASFSNAESVGVGVSSGRYRKASGFGGAEVEEGDDCSLM